MSNEKTWRDLTPEEEADFEKNFRIRFTRLGVRYFQTCREVTVSINETPRTDALVYPNGCLATNLLEHSREMERELAIERHLRKQKEAELISALAEVKSLFRKVNQFKAVLESL